MHFSSCVSVIRIITSQEYFFISFPPMDNAAFCNFCFAETSLSFPAEPVESMCNWGSTVEIRSQLLHVLPSEMVSAPHEHNKVATQTGHYASNDAQTNCVPVSPDYPIMVCMRYLSLSSLLFENWAFQFQTNRRSTNVQSQSALSTINPVLLSNNSHLKVLYMVI